MTVPLFQKRPNQTMNIEQYEKEGRGRYARFAETVANILQAALQGEGRYRLQQIAHRAKAVESPRRKLQHRGVEAAAVSVEMQVKDLAGCRVILYTDADVDRFSRSGLLQQNFAIDWDQTKVHHPTAPTADAASLFRSINYVVRLTDQRATLPEYKEFAGMLCEVQVQTSLNHAWSEMAHDTIYKKPELAGFGRALMKNIEARMADIMRNHLVPAGHEFQKVVNDFERLASGKNLFDQGAFEALASAPSNNERFDVLQRFRDYVLPNYDDHRAVQDQVRAAMSDVIVAARSTPIRPIDTPYGPMDGHKATQVIDVALDVVDAISRIEVESVERTFDLLLSSYPSASTDEERKRFKESGEKLAQNERSIWQNAGPIVQRVLTDRIARVDMQTLFSAEPITLAALDQVLKPEIEGMSSTYDKVTLYFGPVVPSDDLRSVRSKAINTLKSMFSAAPDEGAKRRIWQVMSTATRLPTSGQFGDDLVLMVLENSRAIVDLLRTVALTTSFEFRQEVEHDLLWLYRHNVGPENEAAPISDARKLLTESILAFRDEANSDADFVVYRTLVGFESVFPPAWDDERFGFEEVERYRSDRIVEYVAQLNGETADYWFGVLERCAQTKSNDLATWPTFARFLEQLATAQPDIALSYVQRASSSLATFMPAILQGLEQGPKAAAAEALINRWISEGRHLQQIFHCQHLAKSPKAEVFVAALAAAIRGGNDSAVLRAIEASSARHEDVNGGLLANVFMPALQYLSDRGNTSWVHYIRPVSSKSRIFDELDEVQVDLILGALVPIPKIDYQAEDLLTTLGRKRPERVVDFFGQRMQHQRTAGERYEEFPFKFYRLHEVLSTIPAYLVKSARAWLQADGSALFVYRGGKLIADVFPNVTAELEDILLGVISPQDRASLELVIGILRNYEGQTFTHRILQALVDALEPGDPLLAHVRIALEETGVMRGEFGAVEAYQRKRDEVHGWLSDSRQRVVLFADNYIRELERIIAFEQRRAENELEMRKHEFGTDEQEGQAGG